MITERLTALAARDLRTSFSGPVHLAGDAAYDAQRATFSGAIDPRPALVAEAATPRDVQAAVLTAWENDLPFAVQSTGHGTLVPADGGLLLKTGAMAEVLIDPERRIARVGAGVRWAQVIEAAAPFGLAPVSGTSPDVGVAGFTLGGGHGWLSRRFGLGADNLLSANVVTADGRQLTASPRRNPDLFWALRGGGGNFGVVTSLELRLHPVARLFGGAALFPFERAGDLLAHYRDSAAGRPDDLNVSIVLMKTPPDPRVPGPVVAVRGIYAGEPEQARRALAGLWRAGGPPIADGFAPMGYAGTAAIGGTAPRQFDRFDDLPDALIGDLVAAVSGPEPTASAVEVRQWGGAIARPGADAGPVGHRDTPFSVTVDGPAAAAGPIRRHATGGSFLNFLHDPTRTQDAYDAIDHMRLRKVKRDYDPENFFCLGHNIAPLPSMSFAVAGSL